MTHKSQFIWTLALLFHPIVLSTATAQVAMSIRSSAFGPGEPLPARYTCSAENQSPPLNWRDVPTNARSLALIMSDPDAPSGTYIHWVVFNLAPEVQGLKSAPPNSTSVGGSQGMNSGGKIGYNGPCPPSGPVHHYHFRLYALNRKLSLDGHPDARGLERAMSGHIIASTETVGTYRR
jgi:Raf kinase inhibitor-like YbhB/YbcL family protein